MSPISRIDPEKGATRLATWFGQNYGQMERPAGWPIHVDSAACHLAARGPDHASTELTGTISDSNPDQDSSPNHY